MRSIENPRSISPFRKALEWIRSLSMPTLLAAAIAGAGAADRAVADLEHPAANLVKETTLEVRKALTSCGDQERSECHRAVVSEHIAPIFDTEEMARRLLGKQWKTLPDDRRERFLANFQSLLVCAYASVIERFRNQEVIVLGIDSPGDQKSVRVSTTIEALADASPVDVIYSMRDTGRRWLVDDVLISGVSIVLTYRSSFRSEIRSSGIDGLNDRIEKEIMARSCGA
ncbi:MAG: ABC transporter substrate-binding protein [Ectothiorhodospiraceae bacterium AqS1]|nr:ABC transporter substrate-binding protein [Ectothiorhodospiraceae bacterium AqS1]